MAGGQLPVWELEDEVSELHAFERHSLSPYLSARAINQSLEYTKMKISVQNLSIGHSI